MPDDAAGRALRDGGRAGIGSRRSCCRFGYFGPPVHRISCIANGAKCSPAVQAFDATSVRLEETAGVSESVVGPLTWPRLQCRVVDGPSAWSLGLPRLYSRVGMGSAVREEQEWLAHWNKCRNGKDRGGYCGVTVQTSSTADAHGTLTVRNLSVPAHSDGNLSSGRYVCLV